jgi:sugar-specific transcriptional regulator TrmB
MRLVAKNSPMLDILIQAGLTPTQADILGFLLTQNELKAKELVMALKKPRGVIYKGLDELVALGLVEKHEEPGSVARFRAEHPSKLEALFEEKEKNAQKERKNFLQSLPELTSHYNLAQRKPGVHFYEGKAGLRQVLDDTLRSKTEILLFIDKSSINNERTFGALTDEYKEKRLKAGIKQRIIYADERPLLEPNLGSLYEDLTEIRFIGESTVPFKSSVKIYDNKLSYQVIEGDQNIAVLIEDKNIYEMNKAWFEFLWQMAK